MVYFCLVNDFMLITDSETQVIMNARVSNDLTSHSNKHSFLTLIVQKISYAKESKSVANTYTYFSFPNNLSIREFLNR